MNSIILIIIGAGIAVTALIYFIVSCSKRQDEKLASFAEGLGMEVVKGRWWKQPTLYGTYEGRPLQIRNIYHSTGKSGYYTYKIFYESETVSPDNVEIRISHYGSFSRFFLNIAGIFGYKTVSFDNYEFNSHAIVRSKNEEFAKTLVDIELQQDIQDLGTGKIFVKGMDITYEAYGMAQDNESRIHNVLRLLTKIENKLERLDSDTLDSYSESELINLR